MVKVKIRLRIVVPQALGDRIFSLFLPPLEGMLRSGGYELTLFHITSSTHKNDTALVNSTYSRPLVIGADFSGKCCTHLRAFF